MDSTKQQIDSPGGKHFLRVNTLSLTHTHTHTQPLLSNGNKKNMDCGKVSSDCSLPTQLHHILLFEVKWGGQDMKVRSQGWCSSFIIFTHLVSIHSVLELIQTSWGIRRRRLACSTRHLKSLGRGSWPHRRPDKICHHSKGIKRIQKGSKWSTGFKRTYAAKLHAYYM